MIKCIVLEDEQAAQELLSTYIEKTPHLTCLGVFESGGDIPLSLLEDADLLFLDIQLPELDGISYVKSLQNPPKIIVTSAFSDHALDAFEIAVVDYLLKPFSLERFLKAVNRIKVSHGKSSDSDKTHYIYADKTTYKVKSSEILFIKAEVDYVKIVTNHREILVLDSRKNWNEILSSQGFLQSHRSYIVQLETIVSMSPDGLQLKEHSLPIGASYKPALLTAFRNNQ